MGHWKRRFPTKYLSAADLDDPIDVTVDQIVDEYVTEDDKETKPVVYWREKDVKPCVLNKTRGAALERIAGTPDDDRWPGTRLRCRRGTTMYKGSPTDCVEFVACPAPPAKRVAPKPAAPKPAAPRAPEPDDPMPTTDDDETVF